MRERGGGGKGRKAEKKGGRVCFLALGKASDHPMGLLRPAPAILLAQVLVDLVDQSQERWIGYW